MDPFLPIGPTKFESERKIEELRVEKKLFTDQTPKVTFQTISLIHLLTDINQTVYRAKVSPSDCTDLS